MSEEAKGEIIQPPNLLKNKVGPPGAGGGVDAATLAKAEMVIADMAEDYLDWVQADLDALQGAYDLLANGNDEEKTNALKSIFGVAHDMKGQGGSFNYPLITQVCYQLCRFLEHLETPNEKEMEVIQLHINAVQLIILNQMTGDGGKSGESLVRGLELVLQKVGA
ncbi:Hpt domain-containing protein [Magnetospira sp. QH-2]|uniref:Hpt domain-containing protein n=1 Tax=Magnetospira sp. (strain QH-2) TaxID=1288970 RepID=UPI0003E8117E|nr:Hpt domain-containing protein [Magnetospira sp. QH-2]CCQ74042.1 Conserved protein of unknown function [Magnetospira sp. QH-2]